MQVFRGILKKIFIFATVCSVLFLIFIGLIWISLWYANARQFTLDELKGLDNIDRIELSVTKKDEDGTYRESILKVITAPHKVQLITKKSSEYADNWQYSGFYSSLQGPVGVVFYDGTESKASFGIGYVDNRTSFDENRHYIRKIWGGPGKWLNESEFRDLIGILEVEQTAAYFDVN